MAERPLYSRYYFPDLAAKMEARVQADPVTGCWNWTKGVNADGYGNGLFFEGTQTRAHRVAYLVHNGYLPPREVFVCHLCSNPSCCRPEHLAAGNAWDNAQDTKAAGRLRQNKAARLRKAEALADLMSSQDTHVTLAGRYGLSLYTVSRLSRRAGIKAQGPRRLTEEDVRAIRASEEPSRVLAGRFGVTAPNIHAIRTGKTWRHVTTD